MGNNMLNDLISRQAAIDAIMGEPTDAHYPSWYAERLEQLPSVLPERKKGKWIYPHETTKLVSICSKCGAHGRGNFCSNCGADMRGESE